jgi:cobalt/nickel transport system permease protein
MIEYPQIDRYAGLTSPIHRWDPRAKLVAILSLIFSVVLIPDMMMASVGLAVALLLVFISRLPLRFVLGHLVGVSLFILPLSVIILFTYHQGNEVVRFAFLRVTTGGLEYASLIAVRALAAIILVLPMVGTMRFDVAMKALERLRVPPKLVQMIMFTYRYIFVLIGEFQRMLRALASRGFSAGLNVGSISTMGKLIGMFFIRSQGRAERVYNAMLSRGYEGNICTLIEFKMHKTDILKAAILIAIAVALNVF